MTKVIYKYKLELDDRTDLKEWRTKQILPVGAKILTAGNQGADIFIWALVDKKPESTETVTFRIIPTGLHEFNDRLLDYISTVFMGPYVFHVFKESPYL